MRKITIMLAFLFFAGIQLTFAQTRTISGTVTSADDGSGIPGVTVQVKGTTVGTTTDMDGKYSIDVKASYKTLVYSFVGMKTQEIAIGSSTTIDVVMEAEAYAMDEVVVTALGVTREKKSLGYATQEVSGQEINAVKHDNVINSLSGRVSGVDVRTSGNLGGSTNILIRGNKSLMGNNQALFIVDGVPITNENPNTAYQSRGGQGYDYGTTASDINPNDIKSMTVLKGAAATALYGSRAANGVIIITTKSGTDNKFVNKNGLGITFSSNVTAGTVDKSTFPTYQTQYGGGYGPFYSNSDHPGLYNEDLPWGPTNAFVVPTTEDASYGEKFDPNFMVYQWDAFVPESPNYHKATPWVAAENGPITFFNTAVTTSNTLAVNGSTDKSTFRLSYTNFNQTGILPNSKLTKNTFALTASHKLAKSLTISSDINYAHQKTIGRNGTGYNGNIFTSFRQWWEVNVDVLQQKDMYDQTGRNVTWNMNYPEAGDNSPIYWNNFYWERYNNYENDSRDHIFGNVKAKWDITDYLNIIGRISLDNYSQLMEEHLAVGGVPAAFGIGYYDVPSGYSRNNINFTEVNYNVMANFKKNLTETLNLSAILGGNIRRTSRNAIYASTNGGLIVPGINSIANSKSPALAPLENQYEIGVNGVFASVSLGYNNLLYLDGTVRRDQSSTLPIDNNTYFYPSVSGSFVFSNLLHADWLPFAKLRLSYAEVGNDAPPQSLLDTYRLPSPFGSVSLTSVNTTKNNPELKSELTKSNEVGLEMTFLNRRLGFDADAYLTHSINQIMPVAVSTATGYSYKYVNAGDIQNNGVELNVYGVPVKTKNFNWRITLNWSRNVNKVISLYEDVKNLQLNSYQGGVTINATVGQPYGVIEGTDYVYQDGQKVIASNGYYARSATTNNVLGNSNPDWRGGITNSFSYKNWTASFLIDAQHGGSIFSLDQWYGQGTGLYPESVATNELGNQMRDPVTDDATSGGVLLKGLVNTGTADNPVWEQNTKRVSGNDYRLLGWSKNPNAGFVYDASYVKLREAQISYHFPAKTLNSIGVRSLSLGFVGSNLWIIFKNLPYADPEAGLGSGNTQGWQSGVMPTTRNFGFNLNVKF